MNNKVQLRQVNLKPVTDQDIDLVVNKYGLVHGSLKPRGQQAEPRKMMGLYQRECETQKDTIEQLKCEKEELLKKYSDLLRVSKDLENQCVEWSALFEKFTGTVDRTRLEMLGKINNRSEASSNINK